MDKGRQWRSFVAATILPVLFRRIEADWCRVVWTARLERSLQDDDRVRERGHSDMQFGTIDNMTADNLTYQIRDFDLAMEKYWCKL
jgi:hypothetical protein